MKKQVISAQEKFNTDTKNFRDSKDTIATVRSLIKAGLRNEVSASQVGAAVAKIFEGGRLTDEDVVRYTNRASLISEFKDITQKLAKGTLSPELAKQIEDSLLTYEKGVETTLNVRTAQRARQLQETYGLDPEKVAPIIYGGYKPVQTIMMTNKAGQTYEIPNTAEAIAKFEELDK